MSILVGERELLEKTGYQDRGWLEAWLRRNNIRYWRGRDGELLTTTGLMEAALMGKDAAPAPTSSTARRPIRFAAHGKTSKN